MSSIPESGPSQTLRLPQRTRPTLVDEPPANADPALPEAVWLKLKEQTRKFRDTLPFGCGHCDHAIWYHPIPATGRTQTRDLQRFKTESEPHMSCGIGARPGPQGVPYCSRSTREPDQFASV